MRGPRGFLVGVALLCVAMGGHALAQSGGPFAITSSVIAGGGATASTGGSDKLGGTIGQADAGRSAGGNFIVDAGFWRPLLPAGSAPTATVTQSPPGTGTSMSTPTSTLGANTPTMPPGNTPSATASASPTTTGAPMAISTAVSTPTPTPTSVPCVGDCNGDGRVTVDEMLTVAAIALGNSSVAECRAGDARDEGTITVDDVLAAADNALNACGVGRH